MANETYHPRGVRVHGYAVQEHPLYEAWASMKSRCNDPKQVGYENYGGRGISYCDRWKHFSNFAEDMWPLPYPGAMLERKNNDLGYSPDNCIWATRHEQMRNRRVFRTNTSGFVGVIERKGRFNARYDDHGVRYNLGFFASAIEAATYREDFIQKLGQDPEGAAAMLERRARSDSGTGIKGVSVHSKKGYIVRTTRNGERMYLGYSVDLAGAITLLRGAQ
jgi:hypothetical protein